MVPHTLNLNHAFQITAKAKNDLQLGTRTGRAIVHKMGQVGSRLVLAKKGEANRADQRGLSLTIAPFDDDNWTIRIVRQLDLCVGEGQKLQEFQ